MEDDEDLGDVFAIPDFWAESLFWDNSQDTAALLFATSKDLEDGGVKTIERPTDTHLYDGFFGNPDFPFGPYSGPPTPNSSAESENTDDLCHNREENETIDIWNPLQKELVKPAKFLTWDAFEDEQQNERYSAYITEAGPEVFDAVLADANDILHAENTDCIVIQSTIYAESLLALGLGRSSVLFSWDEGKKSFTPALQHMKVSGITRQTISSHLATFMSCGTNMRLLQKYVDKSYDTHRSPVKIALADAVFTLLSTLQAHLSEPRTFLKSLLRLQAIFRSAQMLLTAFSEVVEIASSAETDEVMLSQLFEKIQIMEHTTDSMRDILLEVLARVSRPFLDFAGEWLGLQRDAGVPIDKKGIGRSFVKVEDRSWVDEKGLDMQELDFVLDTAHLPSFMPVEDAHTLFETGKSLRFLRTHHPEHPLSRPDCVSAASLTSLEWSFTWEDIEKFDQKALKYEQDLIEGLQNYSKPSQKLKRLESKSSREFETGDFDIFSKSVEEVEAYFLKSMAALSKPMSGLVTTNQLSSMLAQSLNETEISSSNGIMFAPPISLTPFLSFGPIIAARARIVNGTSMKLFFKSHKLREHLSILRRFQLMDDGVFSSRLAHALFDSELETAERRAGVTRSGGIVGLRLGGRETWPPATSELRLALMGILTESYTSLLPDDSKNAGGYIDHVKMLPGDLSFAVREMSPDEIERCIDPNSVEALDFLRISYKPPAPLQAVITPLSLFKYDQIFKLLLRVTRMLYVVSQLFRDVTDRTSVWRGMDITAQRFRIEAHHFVTCVSSYFFATGIDTTWQIFERKLDQIEARVNGDANYTILGQNEGLDKLREYHERVLDRIMFALLLKKRQQAVMSLLEEIFGLILGFAKYSRSRALGVTLKVGQDEEVKVMYVRFRRKVEIFITVCRGLSEKKGYGETMGSEKSVGLFDSEELRDENTVAQLLARLEMSNYYSQPVKRA